MKYFLLFWLLFLCPWLVKSQHHTHRLEKTAFDLIKVEDYGAGCPMVYYLDSIGYRDARLPYYKGICVFHTENKAGALPYFLKAKSNKLTEHELPFYLARAFHFNLEFDSAEFYYKAYQRTLDTIHHHRHLIHRYKEIDRFLHNCEVGKKMVNDSLEVRIEHIGAIVNSPYPDYSPVISADESVLLFTSRRPNSTGGELADDGKYYEDIYMSMKDSAGNWSAPIQLGDSINSPGHDACIGLSADGHKLYIYRSWRHHDKSGDIFMSQLNGEKWSKPQKLSGNVNTNSWESSITVSANEEQVFFASDRKGGLGGSDIYVIRKGEDGRYGKPQNLGPTVNTPFDDDSPLIHTDGKTLFFSSKGHDGMGGFDIFVTTYNEKDSTWSNPLNVGYPVSTPGDDIYFSYTADGSKGYFSSYRSDSYGEKDLYIIHRPDDSPSLIVFKGSIKDSETDKPVSATITLTDSETGKIANVFNSNSATGKYVVVLEFGKTYDVTIESIGYMYKSEQIHVPEKSSNIFQYVKDFFLDLIKKTNDPLLAYTRQQELAKMITDSLSIELEETNTKRNKRNRKWSEEEEELKEHTIYYNNARFSKSQSENLKKKLSILGDSGFVVKRVVEYNKAYLKAESNNLYTMNISMDKLEPGAKFVLRNIHFDYDKDVIRPSSKKELDRLHALLIQNKALVLEIAGHTDNRGKLEYNIGLSNRRAQAVIRYLVDKGIDAGRLRSSGYGETMPIASNKTAEGRQFNRRTEFEVLDTTLHYLSHPIKTHVNKDKDIFWHELPMKAHFEVNRGATFYDFSKVKLDELVYFLNKNKDITIAMVARADSTTEKNLISLMKQREKTVLRYLLNKGVASKRIKTFAHDDLPDHILPTIISGEISSRRVEFYILN